VRCKRRAGGSGVGPFGVEAACDELDAVAVGEGVEVDLGRVDGAIEGGEEYAGAVGSEVAEELFLVDPFLGEENDVVVFAVGVEVAAQASGGGAQGTQDTGKGADHLGTVGGIDSKTCS